MTLFNGICQNKLCSFIFNVEGRRPNFCPECGHKIEPKTVNSYELEVPSQIVVMNVKGE